MFKKIFTKKTSEMIPIDTPIKFKNLDYNPKKLASKEYIIRKYGEYYVSKDFPDNAMVVSSQANTYEYIINGERVADIGSFKPILLDRLADYIKRMKKVPNEWELEEIIKSSLHRKDYKKVLF